MCEYSIALTSLNVNVLHVTVETLPACLFSRDTEGSTVASHDWLNLIIIVALNQYPCQKPAVVSHSSLCSLIVCVIYYTSYNGLPFTPLLHF